MLLETILALLFMVLTLGAVSGLYVQTVSKVRSTELKTRAMLLAENKFAELQTGLIDITEGNEGDFGDNPKSYFWKIEYEPTKIPELERMKLTVTYDDEADGFEYVTYQLYSQSLNMSASKLKQIAGDPVKMKELGAGNEGLENLFGSLDALPYGNLIREALLRGGVPAMIDLYNKVASNQISPEDLLALMDDTSGEESQSLSSFLFQATGKDVEFLAGANYAKTWTNYDTEGVSGEIASSKAGLARGGSKDAVDNATQAAQQGQQAEEGGEATASAEEQTPAETSSSMTREEAISKMEKILEQLTKKRKR
jgi:general secretion pathway protein I